jgi:hypothetical protein
MADVLTLYHKEHLSYRSIAANLNARGVPTPAGKTRWHGSYVHRLLGTRFAEEVKAEMNLE